MVGQCWRLRGELRVVDARLFVVIRPAGRKLTSLSAMAEGSASTTTFSLRNVSTTADGCLSRRCYCHATGLC